MTHEQRLQAAIQRILAGQPLQKNAAFLDKGMDAAIGFSQWSADKAMKVMVFGPILLGLASGALVSKLTSPAAKMKVTQKEMIAEELTQLEAEMRRRQALARIKEKLDSAKAASGLGGSTLHI